MKNKTTKYNKRINKKKISNKKRLSNKRKTKKNKKMMGGNTINQISLKPIIDDVSDPSKLIMSRNLPDMTGGKKMNKGNKMNKSKKMKGGELFLGSSSLNNAFTSFGNYGQSSIGSSLILGQDSTSKMFDTNHPSSKTFNEYSPPLV